MLHARKDYQRIQDPLTTSPAGKSSPARGIPKDEPVFLIRAQDPLFVPMLSHYAELAQLVGCDPRLVQSVIAHRELARLWPVRKARPDL
jgi:hypothetical protein